MKKMTLASFVFMVLLVTGASALIVGSGNTNLSNSSTTSNENLTKAKDSFKKAGDALEKLKNSETSNSEKCKAYSEVQKYCSEVSDYDGSEYKDEVQKVLHDADDEMKAEKNLNCEQEKKCQEMKSKFMYKLNDEGNNDSDKLKYEEDCGDHDDGDHKSKDDSHS